MKAFGGLAICLTIGTVTASTVSQPVLAQDSTVTLIEMSPNELAANGIALRELRMRPFPNSCRAAGNAGLSVSDPMLEHFRAQGFSLESLCLGLSGAIHFDPETGRQLPIAHVRVPGKDEYLDVPLNLPRCFRDAVPQLECDFRFDAWIKYRLKPSQIPTGFARKFDVEVRGYIEQNGVSGVFHIEDLGRGAFTSSYQWLLASPALRRGYGYALAGPEGDDPETETTNSTTYQKNGDANPFWNNTQ